MYAEDIETSKKAVVGTHIACIQNWTYHAMLCQANDQAESLYQCRDECEASKSARLGDQDAIESLTSIAVDCDTSLIDQS